METKHTFAFWLVVAGLIALLFWLARVETKVRVIDGCEYVAEDGAHRHTLTHKGNCSNEIHRR